MKRCRRCHQDKPTVDFYAVKDRTSGRHAVCKSCFNELRRGHKKPPPTDTSRRKANALQQRRRDAIGPRAHAESRIRHEYGIDFHDLALLFERQGGRCAGCLRPLVWSQSEHVDHDHQTLLVRGILCVGCNLCLGGAKDNPMTLERLAEYIRASHQR